MKHKKYLIIIVIALIACFFVLGGYSSIKQANSDNDLEYFTELYNILKDEKFFKAKIEEDCILLYDNNFDQICSIAFDSNRNSTKLMYILNEETRMLFVTSQVVDDTTGIVFFPDTKNAKLDGFWTLKRISGNGFIYSTTAP